MKDYMFLSGLTFIILLINELYFIFTKNFIGIFLCFLGWGFLYIGYLIGVRETKEIKK